MVKEFYGEAKTAKEAAELAASSAIENEMLTEGQERGAKDYESWYRECVAAAKRNASLYAEQFGVGRRALLNELRRR